MRCVIEFSGHKNIRSLHKKTIEITKDTDLTERGDCIIGVNASKSCFDLPFELKEKLLDSKSVVKFIIRVGNKEFCLSGRGNQDLILTHKHDIVIRKSSFICPRTLAIKCDKTSDQIPREIIRELQDPKTKGTFTIELD